MPLLARTPQELSAANVAHSAMDNVGFLAAGAVSGLLLLAASPQAVFATAGTAGLLSAVLLAGLRRDRRPAYATETSGRVLSELGTGARSLLADSRLRLVGIALTLLFFFEGAADVLAVIVALDLLGLSQGAVGYLNAAWGIGALLGGAALAVLLHRGQLAAGVALGCLLAGASLALPGIWVVAAIGYVAWLGMGAGYTFVEVASLTLLQRLGSDETLARALSFLESSKFAAMGLGSIAVPGLIALVGVRGTVIAFGAILPAFALLRWSALRAMEIGAPVEEDHFRLLRDHPIFAPLPMDTLERLSHDLVPLSPAPGEKIVTQGEPGKALLSDRLGRGGDRHRRWLSPEADGRRVLRRDRPPQRRAADRDRHRATRLPAAGTRPPSLRQRRDGTPAQRRGRDDGRRRASRPDRVAGAGAASRRRRRSRPRRRTPGPRSRAGAPHPR